MHSNPERMVFSVWLKRLIHHILSELKPQHGSSENPARRYIYNIVLVCFILLLAYVTARSFTLSFTHDESLSFTMVQGKTNWVRSANNHFLNTVLMKICSVVLGDAEWSMRLPNVFSFILYFIGIGAIMRNATFKLLVILGLCILALNPFVLDFFSLARGYGLSLGFMVLSLHFLLRDTSHYEDHHEFLFDFAAASLFAALAMFSNFAMVNYYISVVVLFTLRQWRRHRVDPHAAWNKTFFALFFSSGVMILLGAGWLIYLAGTNHLYHGAESFAESIDSVIADTMYFLNMNGFIYFKFIILAIPVFGTVSIFLNKDYTSKFSQVSLIYFFMILGILLEYHLFGIYYPLGRTGLPFIPVYACYVVFFVEHIHRYYSLNRVVRHSILGLCSVLLIAHFVNSINFTYTKTWHYDAHTKTVAYLLDGADESDLSVSNHWWFEPTLNYYRTTQNLSYPPITRSGPDFNTSYTYIFDTIPIVGSPQELIPFPDIETTLVKN